MSSPQVLLQEYLQCELYHSIGAYGVARNRLGKLEGPIREAYGRVSDTPVERSALEQNKLLKVTRLSREYNELLAEQRHWTPRVTSDIPPGILRHPIPKELPLTLCERFETKDKDPKVKDARRNPWANPLAWAWVVNFYDAAEATLGLAVALSCREAEGDGSCKSGEIEDHAKDALRLEDFKKLELLRENNPHAAGLVPKFAESVVWQRDGSDASETDVPRMEQRRERFKARADTALEILPGIPRRTPPRSLDATEFLHRIATDNLSSGLESVPFFVISAAAEAHLSMHAVEGWLSMSAGAHADRVDSKQPWTPKEWLKRELDRCIVLDTFVYCASRCAPWMFAANGDECAQVFGNLEDCWRYAVPPRCMWISTQLSLLALHRRAYSYSLKGDRTSAYNDYYKLQREIRNARRRVDSAPVHMTGAHEFLTALDARANQNIGELYRAEHAHRPALKHYQTALDSLEVVRERGEMSEVLTNSRWYVELQMSQGKASYEMGKHKESLRWHLRAWQAFLRLLADETQTEASTEKIEIAIKWLEGIRFEPELRKSEVSQHLGPVIEQLRRVRVSQRLGTLASEIVLRLGHVLFVLDLAPEPPVVGEGPSAPARPDTVERLSFDCLKAAAECDPYSTLAGADLLKAYYRAIIGQGQREATAELKLPEMKLIEEQWPRGGEDYEGVMRMAEYLMLLALDLTETIDSGSGKRPDKYLAQRLLLDFFMHTDSINVRKAQTHHYLMRKRQGSKLPIDKGQAAIEFVCMRRYSSATPLLPRPSAFRAHGGGYFVRLHSECIEPPAKESKPDCDPEHVEPLCVPPPFGIVVDPGPDFVENLYRAGFSLSDIDMIIVTHDHVDHLNSLEPLLSLLHYRSDLLKEQNTAELTEKASDGDDPVKTGETQPLVYGNTSVCQRYAKVSILNRNERFKDLGDLKEDDHQQDCLPEGFQIVAMSSKAVDKTGHLDLSNNPSYGICISHLSDISLAITSDTPTPPSKGDDSYEEWLKTWSLALKADALVAHVSTVPLSELRQIAKLDARVVIHPCDAEKLRGEVRDLLDEAKIAERELCDAESELERFLEKEHQSSSKVDNVREEIEAVQTLSREVTSLRNLLTALSRSLDSFKNDSGPSGMGASIRSAEEAGRKVHEQATELIAPLRQLAHRQVIRDRLLQIVDEAQKLALNAQGLPRDAVVLEDIRTKLEATGELRGRIEFAMWLRSRSPGPTADMVGLVPWDPADPTKHWMPPQEHAYLQGTLRWAEEYRQARRKASPDRKSARGLLVLGELSEELGTVRSKIAGRINETLFKHSHATKRKAGIYSLTSDVGLHLVVVPGLTEAKGDKDRQQHDRRLHTPDTCCPETTSHCAGEASRPTCHSRTVEKSCVKILCTTCDLDTDRTATERYHPPHHVYEVCVKGENEGVFYNCAYHDPRHGPKQLFLEQLERFDVFGR